MRSAEEEKQSRQRGKEEVGKKGGATEREVRRFSNQEKPQRRDKESSAHSRAESRCIMGTW